MSGLNSDQLHRSTLGIYMTLMDQFNPSLQRLVALGNNYIQAFQALAATSEAYFSALGKMGEQAMQTMSSHLLGDILIEISESQRRLTSEVAGVFRWFHNEVLQEMVNNSRQDKDYIFDSKRRYEMEVRNQAMALERQLKRGGSHDANEYVQFLRESQREALKEQERRFRFLAEKHCGLTQSFLYLMTKTGNTLQQRAEGWREQVNQTRGSRPGTASRQEDKAGDRSQAWAEQPLGRVPSRGPSPQPTRSRSSSIGESRGSGGGRMMRALVPHPPSSNSTLLPFSKGETIRVLVPEPRNGWLYGCSESSARQGWFPAAYVGPMEDTYRLPDLSGLFRSSMSNLLDQSSSNRTNAPPPPPPPPPPSKSSSSRPVTPTSFENKRQDNYGARPELFPRGTNPFATVKLKPTKTNDRSAPRVG
ncbi:brain-specific angiogenesis inhibitor 1-associated protein 2-like protein 2 isoform X2 [Pangasianodon hypophthalmus]|uniref:brain-specific angiogenesis inhibitor 1-associated protein 2-like protein 2 isoform X2 n=1 Tax=Pangasianodon hypophthalmus TaxID=310915 RepID=UPI000EFE73E2|nr:brain-specific angiogenesis inhibitor 1-associated protein 2-like protein 2 isoform X2 [Pangasianodon hypophthalmus]